MQLCPHAFQDSFFISMKSSQEPFKMPSEWQQHLGLTKTQYKFLLLGRTSHLYLHRMGTVTAWSPHDVWYSKCVVIEVCGHHWGVWSKSWCRGVWSSRCVVIEVCAHQGVCGHHWGVWSKSRCVVTKVCGHHGVWSSWCVVIKVCSHWGVWPSRCVVMCIPFLYLTPTYSADFHWALYLLLIE